MPLSLIFTHFPVDVADSRIFSSSRMAGKWNECELESLLIPHWSDLYIILQVKPHVSSLGPVTKPLCSCWWQIQCHFLFYIYSSRCWKQGTKDKCFVPTRVWHPFNICLYGRIYTICIAPLEWHNKIVLLVWYEWMCTFVHFNEWGMWNERCWVLLDMKLLKL